MSRGWEGNLKGKHLCFKKTQVKSPLKLENALEVPGHPEQNKDGAIGRAAAEVDMEDADADSVEPCVVYVVAKTSSSDSRQNIE